MSLKRLRIIKSLIIIAGMSAFLTSCSDDPANPAVEPGKAFRISVTAASFTPSGIETRATDSGYTTSLVAGDTIGITVIKDDTTILEDNIPYKYDGSVWSPAIPDDSVYFHPGTNISYVVYYPYNTNMGGKTTTAAVVSAFTPKADQSNPTAYAGSDLMTGTGVLDGTILTVTLTHAFSLIELNYSSEASDVTLKVNGGAPLKPYSFGGGTFRCIVVPQDNPVELIGSETAGGKTMLWQLANVMLTEGKYIKINILEENTPSGSGVQVVYTDGTNETASITDTGLLKLATGAGKTVMKIVLLDKGYKEYLIGRKTDQDIYLNFDTNGDLLFRPAATDGYIPIGSYAEFQKINSNNTTRAGKYRQEADLDLMNAAWTPVCNSTNRFTGTYEGNNKIISNLSINTSVNYVGLFGSVSGTVINLTITEAKVIGGSRTGSLAGHIAAGAVVTNCNTDGEVGGADNVGGVVGYSEGTITRCHNKSTVSAGNYAGGIAGYITNGSTVEICENIGDISGTSRIGGVVGYVTVSSTLNASKSTGTVSGTANMVGGVAGQALNGGVVRNCYATGEVVGVDNVGGVIGCITNGTTTGFTELCYSTSVVRGRNYVSGVAGLVNAGASLSNCVALNSIVYASSTNVGRVVCLVAGNAANDLALVTMSSGGGKVFPGGTQAAHNQRDGKGITLDQAMMQTTYVNYVASDFPVPLNWDFVNVWKINEGNGYPTLQWE